MKRQENLGAVFQLGCFFYGIEYCQLSVFRNDEMFSGDYKVSPDTSGQTLSQKEGPFLKIFVSEGCPQLGTFDRAVLDLVKVLGSSFALDRSTRLLRIDVQKDADSACKTSVLPGDTLALPEVYHDEAQFYHWYNSTAGKMTTVRCSLATIVHSLQSFIASVDGVRHHTQQSKLERKVIGPDSAYSYMQTLIGEADIKFQASAGSRFDEDPQMLDKMRQSICRATSYVQKAICTGGGRWQQAEDTAENTYQRHRDFIFGALPASTPAYPILPKVLDCPKSVVPAVTAAMSSMSLADTQGLQLVEILSLSGHNAVLRVPPDFTSSIQSTLVAGVLCGATIGSTMGPVTSAFGALVAAACAAGMHALSPNSQTVSIPDASYIFDGALGTQGTHPMYTLHDFGPKSFAFQGAMLSAMVNASVNGMTHLSDYFAGKITHEELMRKFTCDLGGGVALWAAGRGISYGLQAMEIHMTGPFGVLATIAAQNQTVVAFLVLGSICTAQEKLDDWLQQFSFWTAGACGMMLTTQSLGIAAMPGLLPVAVVMMTTQCISVFASCGGHELRKRRLMEELRKYAMDFLGLAPGFTQKYLQRRWRVLARMSHPDRNRSHDAKNMFMILGLCRQVLTPKNSDDFRFFLKLRERVRNIGLVAREDSQPACCQVMRPSRRVHHRVNTLLPWEPQGQIAGPLDIGMPKAAGISNCQLNRPSKRVHPRRQNMMPVQPAFSNELYFG